MSVPAFEPVVDQQATNGFVQPPAQQTPAPEVRFTAEDLERARQEEKQKVYSRLEQEAQARKALEDRVNALLQTEQEREAAAKAERERQEAEARAAAEAEMSAKDLLAQKEQEWREQQARLQTDWEQRFEQMAQERAQEQAMLEKEKELAALAAYTANRIAEERDNIAPQFIDFIAGNTQAEIDQSIERAKAKTAEIISEFQQAQTQQRAQQRGVAPTGYAPVGPLEVEGGQRQYSAEDIRGMSVQEYAKFRQQVGIGGSGQGRGLFG